MPIEAKIPVNHLLSNPDSYSQPVKELVLDQDQLIALNSPLTQPQIQATPTPTPRELLDEAGISETDFDNQKPQQVRVLLTGLGLSLVAGLASRRLSIPPLKVKRR